MDKTGECAPAGCCARASRAGFDFSNLGADWLGTCLTNDGQLVSAEDACALAAALETDLPEWFSPSEQELVEEELQDGLLDIMGTSPLEFFAGDEKPQLVQFIRFCRLGSFEIL